MVRLKAPSTTSLQALLIDLWTATRFLGFSWDLEDAHISSMLTEAAMPSGPPKEGCLYRGKDFVNHQA